MWRIGASYEGRTHGICLWTTGVVGTEIGRTLLTAYSRWGPRTRMVAGIGEGGGWLAQDCGGESMKREW